MSIAVQILRFQTLLILSENRKRAYIAILKRARTMKKISATFILAVLYDSCFTNLKS